MMLQIKHLGKVIGHLRPDRTFVTHRKPAHFFRKYKGFGLSYPVIKQLRNRGCLLICLLYKNSQDKESIYFTTLEDMILKGIHYTDKEFDRQMILPLKEWHNPHTPMFPMENEKN